MEIQGDFCPMFFVVCLNLQNFSHLLKFASTYFKKMKIKIAFNLSHSKLQQEAGKRGGNKMRANISLYIQCSTAITMTPIGVLHCFTCSCVELGSYTLSKENIFFCWLPSIATMSLSVGNLRQHPALSSRLALQNTRMFPRSSCNCQS